MENKYDLKTDGNTPIPMSWFSIDIKLGCLQIHLDEENWNKCKVSELATNIQLMISMHHMDQGSIINYDVEEKETNLGIQLLLQELVKYNEDLNFIEIDSLEEVLLSNHGSFKALYKKHYEELKSALEQMQTANRVGSMNIDQNHETISQASAQKIPISERSLMSNTNINGSNLNDQASI